MQYLLAVIAINSIQHQPASVARCIVLGLLTLTALAVIGYAVYEHRRENRWH